MSYVDAASSASDRLALAKARDVDTVHLALELALFGWARWAADASQPWRWDLLGTAVQEVAALFHRRDPIVILLDADADTAGPAWPATTAMVAAIVGHLDRHFDGDLIDVPRQEWRRAAAVLRSALAAAS
jgi:hypothetical protein